MMNGKKQKSSKKIRNPTGMIMHERARLYGAEDYTRIKTIIDLKELKKNKRKSSTQILKPL